MDAGRKDRAMAKANKRHLEKGILHIEATFNNTKAILTDEEGQCGGQLVGGRTRLQWRSVSLDTGTPPQGGRNSSVRRACLSV
jgi:ribosomal protein S11